jgi:hypothetical protein
MDIRPERTRVPIHQPLPNRVAAYLSPRQTSARLILDGLLGCAILLQHEICKHPCLERHVFA